MCMNVVPTRVSKLSKGAPSALLRIPHGSLSCQCCLCADACREAARVADPPSEGPSRRCSPTSRAVVGDVFVKKPVKRLVSWAVFNCYLGGWRCLLLLYRYTQVFMFLTRHTHVFDETSSYSISKYIRRPSPAAPLKSSAL